MNDRIELSKKVVHFKAEADQWRQARLKCVEAMRAAINDTPGVLSAKAREAGLALGDAELRNLQEPFDVFGAAVREQHQGMTDARESRALVALLEQVAALYRAAIQATVEQSKADEQASQAQAQLERMGGLPGGDTPAIH
ncbi:hypothetical protein [Halomonas ramblicola]|uniref:hypothetical protein n=1 Tax=Halomonas ramblicola TaxID=747349 RepID=UPI0025B301DF|nr:hypothetical protein [Halomonas ramblicola]MDN3521515.1 hypothetical protein [Halomonas ramblicola]